MSVQVLISEDGLIISAQAIDGSPLLQFAARESACGAKFAPTLLAGNPIKVSGVIFYAGVSGFLEPSGRWYGVVPGPEGVSTNQVFPRQEITIYARYGDWFAWLCVAVVFFALLRIRQQSSENVAPL